MSDVDVILGNNVLMMLLCRESQPEHPRIIIKFVKYLDASYDYFGITTKVITRIVMCATVAKSRGHRVGIIKQTTRARLAEMILPIRC